MVLMSVHRACEIPDGGIVPGKWIVAARTICCFRGEGTLLDNNESVPAILVGSALEDAVRGARRPDAARDHSAAGRRRPECFGPRTTVRTEPTDDHQSLERAGAGGID